MTPAISIIIPHLRERENDKALRVALDCIIDNTDLDYELMVESVAERRDIYPVINNMAARARAEWLVFANSDTFLAPGWASAFYAVRDTQKIIGGVIVECGAIPVNDRNYERNFGRTPETFDRAGFEAFVANGDVWRDGEIWYFPCLIHKGEFLSRGGFDTRRGKFPDDPIDLYFWEAWKRSGRTVERVKSYSYHLQNYSTDDANRIHDRFHRA
jgi:hypothetical protein